MHIRDKIKHFVKLVCLITEVNDKEKMCFEKNENIFRGNYRLYFILFHIKGFVVFKRINSLQGDSTYK